jgi:curved DNA-binding protein CbpA
MSIVDDIEWAREVLSLPPLSSLKELKAIYKNLQKNFHPDVIGENNRIRDINRAYNIIKDYIENYRFRFNKDEILSQHPSDIFYSQG